MDTFYFVIALVTAALLVSIMYRAFFRGRRTPRRDELQALPMTQLQKRAWLGLAIGVLVSITLTALLAARGPTQFFADDATRFTFYGILAGGGLLWGLVYWLTRQPSGVSLDERDRAILARAPAIQSGLILLTLAAWMIGLTEAYRAEGSIPIVFASLIFWSGWMMHMLGLSIGVLYGFWRAQSGVQG
jgi:hypothetical protein